MNFVVGELVKLKDNINRFPLQQTKIVTPSVPTTFLYKMISHQDIIVILRMSLNLSIFVMVNGQAGWLPISVVQKVQ